MKRAGAAPGVLWLARTAFAIISIPIPLSLFWLSFHSPGISLNLAISSRLTTAAYSQFFALNNAGILDFWSAMGRSYLYSIVAGSTVFAVSIAFVLYCAFWSRQTAAGVTYFLLGLTLLPQTFLVLAILQMAALFGFSTANSITIVASLVLALTPIGCWALWLVIGDEMPQHLLRLLADRVTMRLSVRVSVQVFFGRALLVFLILIAFALGNFVIPFSLGNNKTYTGLVTLLSFSTNLGRDWATIAAAGVILLAPIIAIAIVVSLTTSTTLDRS